MTETQWGEEVEEQKATSKGGIPTWVWGCGGGCLLFLILGIVGMAWLAKVAKEEIAGMTDPAVQQPKVARYMPFEEWPEGYTAMGVPFVERFADGMTMVMVMKDDYMALLMGFETEDAEGMEEIFDPEFEGGGPFGLGKWQDVSEGALVIDGHEARYRKFTASNASFGAEDASRPSMMLDLTGQGPGVLLVQITRTSGVAGTIEDQEVLDLLEEPFDVWGDREPDALPAGPEGGGESGGPGEAEGE